jgi:hypothetical protein
MAAALQHARRGDSQRAVLLTGYAYSRLTQEKVMGPITLPMQQRVRERATAEYPAATVEVWLRGGVRLTEEQAAAIAFDDAPLDAPCDERSAIGPGAGSDSTLFAA